MRRAGALAALALLVALPGCGGTTHVRERTVVVTPSQSGEVPRTSPRPSGGVRIAVVTHGQASSPFWAIVRNGVEAAARQMDVVVDYRAPDVYSLQRMEALIDQAVASHPDGLVVSIPEPGLAPAIRRAVKAGIPVVSINSGSDVYRRLGVLAHVGQPEERAGFESGKRMAAAGVRSVLCVNQQIGNQGLDARCRGLARAMRAAGGRSRVLGVDDQSPATPRKIADAVRSERIDGILALNATSGIEAVKGARQLGSMPASEDRDLRSRPRRPARRPRPPTALRGRPAGLPAGLPADRAAHRAGALRPLPGPGRRPAHRSELRDRARRGQGDRAQQALHPLSAPL